MSLKERERERERERKGEEKGEVNSVMKKNQEKKKCTGCAGRSREWRGAQKFNPPTTGAGAPWRKPTTDIPRWRDMQMSSVQVGHSPSGRVVSSSFVSFPQFQTATPKSLVFVEFHPVLASRDITMGVLGFQDQVKKGFTGFYRVLLGFTGYHQV